MCILIFNKSSKVYPLSICMAPHPSQPRPQLADLGPWPEQPWQMGQTLKACETPAKSTLLMVKGMPTESFKSIGCPWKFLSLSWNWSLLKMVKLFQYPITRPGNQQETEITIVHPEVDVVWNPWYEIPPIFTQHTLDLCLSSLLPCRLLTWRSSYWRNTQRICWVETTSWMASTGARSSGTNSGLTSPTMQLTCITKTGQKWYRFVSMVTKVALWKRHLLQTTVGKVFGAYQQTFVIQMMRLMWKTYGCQIWTWPPWKTVL